MKIYRAACVALIATICSSHSLVADFTEFGNLGDYMSQFPTGSFEDFEEARVPDGTFGTMENVLNSATDNDIFLPGEIVDGLQLNVGQPDNNMLISSPGVANYVSHAVTYNANATTSPQISIDFLNGDVRGFAFDLTSNPNGNQVLVSVFSGGNLLDSIAVSDVQGAGTFFGGFSDSDLITRVELSSANNFFGVDNIRFSTIPEPGACIVLTGVILGCITRRRR